MWVEQQGPTLEVGAWAVHGVVLIADGETEHAVLRACGFPCLVDSAEDYPGVAGDFVDSAILIIGSDEAAWGGGIGFDRTSQGSVLGA